MSTIHEPPAFRFFSSVTWLLIAALVLPWSMSGVLADEPAASVRLAINFGDGSEKHYTQLPWREGMTVLDVLEEAKKHPRPTPFTHRGSGATTFVTSIGGLENEGKGRNWTFRVNGELGDRSAAVFPVKSNDNVLWIFAARP